MMMVVVMTATVLALAWRGSKWIAYYHWPCGRIWLRLDRNVDGGVGGEVVIDHGVAMGVVVLVVVVVVVVVLVVDRPSWTSSIPSFQHF